MQGELEQRLREVSQEVRTTQACLRSILREPAGSVSLRTGLHDLANKAPDAFFEAGFSLLESTVDSSDVSIPYARLLSCPEFLIELTRPGRFNRAKLLDLCLKFIRVAKRLDIDLADLLPGRSGDKYQLPRPAIARILDILNEISAGPRLVLLLSHLTTYPDSDIAERAIVLMGRRICNANWPQRFLTSSDEGVRASALESLWGRKTPAARTALWGCVKDPSDRVVGNALLGLHTLEEDGVDELTAGMLRDARVPFRSTAARVMAQVGKPEYAGHLMQATSDCDAAVRLEAKKALATLRRASLRRQAAAEAASVPPAVPEPPVAKAPPKAEESDADLVPIHIRLDGKYLSSG
ncbi:hypothetical protein SBA3_1510020 [Candidatus Sulfopaludibacter sp. SbA3]|nr:hypothetical protein SBA3_1510020 [Candidatus Sulfopaludibacter sp. SbA3]